MLTDVDFGPLDEDQSVERLGTGLYLCRGVRTEEVVGKSFFRVGPYSLSPLDGSGGYGFDPYLEEDRGEYYFARRGFPTSTPYGTCDNPEQIRDFYGSLLDNPEQPIVITIQEIKWHPESQWRWHKNGPYIGDQVPQAEYFGDEPVIRRVLSYHIYALNGLTTADVEMIALAVFCCYDESEATLWAALSPERRDKYRQHARMLLEMFLTCQDVAPRRNQTIQETVAIWYYRLDTTDDKSAPEWIHAPAEKQAEYVEFIDTFWTAIQQTGIRWLPPLP